MREKKHKTRISVPKLQNLKKKASKKFFREKEKREKVATKKKLKMNATQVVGERIFPFCDSRLLFTFLPSINVRVGAESSTDGRHVQWFMKILNNWCS